MASDPREELDDPRDEDGYWEEDPDNPSGKCHWCGGEGWEECHDPIQCTSHHNRWGQCICASCGGSGLAKDMTIW
jgi:hypothetical protein